MKRYIFYAFIDKNREDMTIYRFNTILEYRCKFGEWTESLYDSVTEMKKDAKQSGCKVAKINY